MDDFDPYYKWLGIPPEDQPPNHYRLLGIEIFEQDREVIESAANRQSAYLTSVASGSHKEYSSKLINEISSARVHLLDPKRRIKYDASLRAELGSTQQDDVPLAVATAITEQITSVIPLAEDSPVEIQIGSPNTGAAATARRKTRRISEEATVEANRSRRLLSIVSTAVVSIAIVLAIGVFLFGGGGEPDVPPDSLLVVDLPNQPATRKRPSIRQSDRTEPPPQPPASPETPPALPNSPLEVTETPSQQNEVLPITPPIVSQDSSELPPAAPDRSEPPMKSDAASETNGNDAKNAASVDRDHGELITDDHIIVLKTAGFVNIGKGNRENFMPQEIIDLRDKIDGFRKKFEEQKEGFAKAERKINNALPALIKKQAELKDKLVRGKTNVGELINARNQTAEKIESEIAPIRIGLKNVLTEMKSAIKAAEKKLNTIKSDEKIKRAMTKADVKIQPIKKQYKKEIKKYEELGKDVQGLISHLDSRKKAAIKYASDQEKSYY